MTIVEGKPDELVRIKLDFVKPFEAACDVDFTFKPESGKTVVTWTMKGHNNFIAKAFHFFMDMDKMLGAEFEKGLAQLKTIAESAAKP